MQYLNHLMRRQIHLFILLVRLCTQHLLCIFQAGLVDGTHFSKHPNKTQKIIDTARARIPRGHIVKTNSSTLWVATYLLIKSIKYTHSKAINPCKLNQA